MIKNIKKMDSLQAPQENKDGRPAKHRRSSALKSCPIFQDIHDSLVKGIPVATVVKTTQERGYFTKTKPNTLQRMFERYLKEVPPGEIIANKIPLIVVRALEKIEPVIETIKEIQGTIRFHKNRIERKWNMVAQVEAKLEKIINDEKNPEYAAALLQNMFKLSEGVEADTVKLIYLYKLSVEVQAEAGILQRNLGTLDVNVVKYEASIREIAKTSSMKVENIEALLKNPQSMYKVMDFVKALRRADPKIIDRFLKEDRKMLEEAKHKK